MVLNDPNSDLSLKNAAFRRLIEEHDYQVLEDEFGNRILIDKDGNPVLDK
jgi:hypothetical protein